MRPKVVASLDVGERRIGVAVADAETRIPVPLTTLDADGSELEKLQGIIADRGVGIIVVGLPRNQQGEETRQSEAARAFADKLQELNLPVVFQDESLTSVLAEQQLIASKKPFTKADIDMHAAAIILRDYLDINHGH